MEPAPINFLDKSRYAQRTLYGLYNTITQGVPGTSMNSFHQMNAEDRWALAFYVGQLALSERDYSGASELMAKPGLAALTDVRKFTVTTPAEAESDSGADGAVMMAWLRTHPESLFSTEPPLQFSRHRLDDVMQAYSTGDHNNAYRLAVEAYLEGFELVEHGLNAVDTDLRLEIEEAMTQLRNQIRNQVDDADLEATIAHIQGLLDVASQRLDGRSLTGSAAFVSALFILVREGLEALLVVAALVAFLVKTEHRANVRYLHFGWIGALLVGILTWWASISIVEISGAGRETTEGVAALVAATVLFYVGFWMHDKTSAIQWKAFIEQSMNKALSAGALWGLAGLSFIAVYREVFETILFFQALWVQTDSIGKSMVLGGIGAGGAVLAVLAWIVFRYSMRLPLRQFFSVSGLLMLILALVFAGKGVAALQESGFIPVYPVAMPRIDLLGIYPNLQGLLVQGALLVLALYLWYGLPGRRKVRN
jgi:high-affinity iron transporter